MGPVPLAAGDAHAAPPVVGPGATRAVGVSEIYAEHKDFVWATLNRLGVCGSQREDVLQEVFLAVVRGLHRFDQDRPIRPWLFGICLRLVANNRRRLARRREDAASQRMDAFASASESPEALVTRQQAEALLQAVLDRLDLDKRAIFVMFEVDGLSCQEIAEMLGVAVGTVYSRLHHARAAFTRALERERRRRRGRMRHA